MNYSAILLICLGLARVSFGQRNQAGNEDNDQGRDRPDGQSDSDNNNQQNRQPNSDQNSQPNSDQNRQLNSDQNSQERGQESRRSRGPPPSGSSSDIESLRLQRPDGIADYLKSVRRPGLRMTVDTVDEGFKRKNKNSFQDAQISIKDKNSTDFTRTGQTQNFEGPNFKLRTAVLRENTDDKSRTHVVTAQDSEKNFTRKNDRLTQFVGTLDTDQFSAGALLTDHSNRGISGSVRQTNDGNRESRLQKQNTNKIVRGSFLKAANLSINSRFESDSFSNRERLVSDIVLGGGDSSSGDGGEDNSQE